MQEQASKLYKFSLSADLSIKFKLLINTKITKIGRNKIYNTKVITCNLCGQKSLNANNKWHFKIVSILKCKSRIIFMLSCVEHEIYIFIYLFYNHGPVILDSIVSIVFRLKIFSTRLAYS